MLFQKAMGMLNTRLPKVISPGTHAIIDYAAAAAFFIAGARAWRQHKRAALAALFCGAMEASTAMLTDYPGGLVKAIDFDTHGKIDAGFAGLVATMPNFMGFASDPQAGFFRGQSLALGAATAMTDFRADVHAGRRERQLNRRVAA